jgi:hypothetical protein
MTTPTFNPSDRFYVQTRSDAANGLPGTVLARYMTDLSGNVVINQATGLPYIVPASFNMADFVATGQRMASDAAQRAAVDLNVPDPDGSLRYSAAAAEETYLVLSLREAFQPNGALDIQRSYNGSAGNGGDGFVDAFTPAASFVFGVTTGSAGVSDTVTFLGGGYQNVRSAIDNIQNGRPSTDLSGYLLNAPANVPNVQAGLDFVRANGITPDSIIPQGVEHVTLGSDDAVRSVTIEHQDGTRTIDTYARLGNGQNVETASQTLSTDNTVLSTTTLQFDGDGRVVSASTSNVNGSSSSVNFAQTNGTGSVVASTTETSANGESEEIHYSIDASGHRYADSIIDRNAAGQITSSVTGSADGSAVLNEFQGGQVIARTFTDADGNLLRTVDYANDGSASESFYNDSGNISNIQNINAAGVITSQQWLDESGAVVASQNNDQNGQGQTFNAGGQSHTMQDLASSLGSTIGGFLGGNSLVERVAAGTAISTIAGRFGALVDQSINTSGAALNNSGSSLFDTAFHETLAQDGTVTSLGWGGDAIAGGLSSLLVGEAAQALGLHGFAATAFNTVAGSVTTQLMRDAYGIISAGGDLTETSLGQLFNGVAHRRTYARGHLSTRIRGMQARAVARKTQRNFSQTKCKTRDICP